MQIVLSKGLCVPEADEEWVLYEGQIQIDLQCTNRTPKLAPGSLKVNVAFEGSHVSTKG